VPLGGGEFQDVDVVAHQDVLHHWAVLHRPGGDRPAALGDPQELVHQWPPLDVDRQPQGQGQTPPGGVGVGQDPKARGISGNVVEQHGRRVVGVVKHFSDPTDVLLPARPAHIAELAQAADPVQPVA